MDAITGAVLMRNESLPDGRLYFHARYTHADGTLETHSRLPAGTNATTWLADRRAELNSDFIVQELAQILDGA